MWTKTTLIFAVILIGCICIWGCSTQSGSSNTDANNSIISIEDISGRKVDVPKEVESIATVGSAARLATYAGCADKLIAITEMDKPNALRPYTIANSEKFANLPTTSNGNHINATEVDIEKLIELSPDVILSTRPQSECQQLQEKTKIPVIEVYSQDEMFDGKLYKSISIIGTCCGCEQKANNTIEFLKGCQKELQSFTKTEISVYRGAVNFKGSKGLTGTVSNYPVYEVLSIHNTAHKDNIQGSYDTSIEDIISANPEYIFIDYQNAQKVKTEYDQYQNVLNQCSAFKNNKVYMSAPFNNNGTNVEYALCEAYYTAKILGLSDINLEQKFENIYVKLLGKDISDELAKMGVKFEQATL